MRVQHLFYSSDVERQTLHRRICPTAIQRTEQQERWQDLRDFLVVDLKERSGFPISSWLQGSYKFGTQICPAKRGDEFDIDLGIYFNWPGTAHAAGVDPARLKSLVQQSLLTYANEAEGDVLEVVSPPKERCSRMRFSGNFHIDVPCYHLDAGRDARELATQSKGWEVSDPKSLFTWFQREFADDDSAQARRLTRYLKMWAALRLRVRPASVLLTVLVADALRRLKPDEVETDDIALRNVAVAILGRLAVSSIVENPANRKENLNRMSPEEIEAFEVEVEALTGIANRALEAATEATAAQIWVEAFDHFFPAPREAVSGSNAIVPVAFDPEIVVEARPEGSSAVFRNINQIGPIPKKCKITFTLQNASRLPPGAQVRWIVRNEGEEAELSNDLGHVGEVGLSASENSAYRGTHFMDVVVVSSAGGVVGFRRVPVRISGNEMPPRNPKRPGYTRFRKGRGS